MRTLCYMRIRLSMKLNVLVALSALHLRDHSHIKAFISIPLIQIILYLIMQYKIKATFSWIIQLNVLKTEQSFKFRLAHV